MASFSFLSNCQGGIRTVSVISTNTNMVASKSNSPGNERAESMRIFFSAVTVAGDKDKGYIYFYDHH